jgi:murein DD-endopeptidase MepM/ murein hydrolase activator NlpD
MGAVKQIVFLGKKGARDDRKATVTAVTEFGLDVVVPAGARTGTLRAINGDGNQSKPSKLPLKIVGQGVKGPRLDALVDSGKIFYDGARKPVLRIFTGVAAAAVQIELARPLDPFVMATWTESALTAGGVRTVLWDGRVLGKPVTDGRYEFRVRIVGAGARSAQAEPTVVEPFTYLSFRFPVDGRHNYGQSAARFGSGRSGRGHQGQDVFARCGTPIVAARGGVVIDRKRHSLAGNYVVIDTDGADDHMYAHMRKPALVKKGARVGTGELIGYVGDTGDAAGCHLHFEAWPSGYQKGSPIDPRPLLKAWDALTGA